MIIALLYYLIIKIIGITTKILFKTDYTKELQEQFKKELIQYLTEP